MDLGGGRYKTAALHTILGQITQFQLSLEFKCSLNYKSIKINTTKKAKQ
ncbi:hypothetical protein SPWS13_2537 [Shewanella putrefaciens]|nr:hypothetical protein SPWS13_2537 [Shewanella putrefaciens]